MGDITKAAVKAHDDAKSYGIDKIAFNFTNVNKRSLTHDVFDDVLSDDKKEDTVSTTTQSEESSAGSESKQSGEQAETSSRQSDYSDTL